MTLPLVLRDPPWRRGPKADRAPASPLPEPTVLETTVLETTVLETTVLETTVLEPVAPSLAWLEGERADFARGAGKRLTGETAERLFEKLLDRIDTAKPIPSSELDRLPDDLLAELGAELTPATVDIPSLKHLLGRLGDAFAARAVALVRARPASSGLFGAAAPLCASELADVAAQLFATQDRDAPASDAERWLMRFPRAALVGLAPHEGAAQRSALRYVIARSGAPRLAIEGPLGAEIAAIAALAPTTRELALAIARGEDEAVLAALRDAGEHAVPIVARMLSGRARPLALAWLEARRDAALRVLSSIAERDAHAATALDVLGGDRGAGDPELLDVPAAIPKLPAFVRFDALPRVLARDGTPLPEDAMLALTEMLRFSPLERPYVGLAHAREACDAASLDAFAAALLEAWIAEGEAPIERWCLDACGKIGGEVCAREVSARVRSWAYGASAPRSAWDDEERRVVLVQEGDRGWAYARAGVAALGAIDHDLALTALDDLARRASTSWLRKEAGRVLESARVGRAVRPAELEDEMVPDLGLDAGGTMQIDVSERSFRVAFDELLVPRLLDADGKTVPFPRKRKADDDAAYDAAKARWSGLTRDAKLLAKQQLGALEEAMCTGRVWKGAAFEERFLRHPVLRHLARRLVWCVREEGAGVTGSFRVAEDLTLADAEDEPYTLPRDARIAIAHPLDLPPAIRARWQEVFTDYAILQPFVQVGRESATIEGVDEEATEIRVLRGRATSRGRLFGMARRGWNARAEDGVLVRWERDLPRSRQVASFTADPGIEVGDAGAEEQAISRAWCTVPLAALPDVDRAELLRDLAWLAAV